MDKIEKPLIVTITGRFQSVVIEDWINENISITKPYMLRLDLGYTTKCYSVQTDNTGAYTMEIPATGY